VKTLKEENELVIGIQNTLHKALKKLMPPWRQPTIRGKRT